MRHNIGTVDSMIRISGGLALLSYYTAKAARQKPSGMDYFMTVMGAQKVAEGITRYCPLTEAMGMKEKGSDTATR